MSQDQNEETPDFIIEDVNLADENLKGWNGEFGPQLAPGDYEVEVVKAVVETNKAQTGRNLVLDLKVVTEGEFKDQTVKQWLGLPTAESKQGVARRLAHVVRDVLQVPLLPNGGFQTSALIGRHMLITATVEQQKDFDPVRSQEVMRERTRIQNERPIENAAPPVQQKAANAPASKPPGQPVRPATKPAGQPVGARR
jgi:hypothetical protein